MHIELPGTAGPHGWPEPGCRCASCNGLRTAGVAFEPTRVLVDGVPLGELPRSEVPGGYDVRPSGGGRILVSEGPGACPEPASDVTYDAVLLDLIGHPEHLGWLRHRGAVTAATRVLSVHNDHRIASPAELGRRLARWARPSESTYRTLLLGGSRSGKSAEAELRLLSHPSVTYVATAAFTRNDPEWKARVDAHRSRRPHWWTTEETTDVAPILRSGPGALLIDGIGSWLASVMDAAGAWDDPDAVRPALDDLVAAWRSTEAHVVAVTDEVGLSLIPTTRAGRLYGDLLGTLNQRLAAESEETALIVAGRVLATPS
ncbi:bifunctional adenosylcobinamide kinase/adenosylcobinamide-phosphate guanylyltransferase [Thermomonospora umbrina]|uniref:Adenosylcobinamide kinase n=1 Tax=Thermomonospora umbrina TaxID=111806 RepID=A0A3D9T466_9ACTN|nr:bifunctional adenosylcobinamide kinase/adenosylcobinamide-phosphate guanylyltransferase [Thermomonospora umbrina]REE99494.1 adenosylcobinamide kinase /adenosylcobinamide-phosphate guanylyltransferase [Thermomonospora umbrina]